MNRFFKHILSFLTLSLIFSVFFSSPQYALGEGADTEAIIWGSDGGVKNTDIKEKTGLTADKDPRLFIASIVRMLLGFLGIIMVIIILLAGYKWMMAQGNADEITKAKDMMKNAVIGLAIVLGAFTIAETIIKEIVDAGAKTSP